MTIQITTEDIHRITTQLREHTAKCKECSGFLHFAGNDGLQAHNLMVCYEGQKILFSILNTKP